MPYKYAEKKGWHVPKQKHKVSNWSEYNQSLCHRGNIDIWLSDEAIEQWYEKNQVNDGSGKSKVYSDFSIIVCHEIRQVYKLPLRQTEGFINSLFRLKDLPIECPDYTSLSKRLSLLNIRVPRYKKTAMPDEKIVSIAIDSLGLKRFGRDEWHQEKYKVSAKRSWRKLHIAVDDQHIIHGAALTDRFVSDDQVVNDLADQINREVGQFGHSSGSMHRCTTSIGRIIASPRFLPKIVYSMDEVSLPDLYLDRNKLLITFGRFAIHVKYANAVVSSARLCCSQFLNVSKFI